MNSDRRDDDAAAYYCDNALGPETYDWIYGPLYTEALDFYVACAGKYGGPLLEIGCGTGLVTWALANAGHNVVGIDVSARMLDVARAKKDVNTPATNARVEFLRADMKNFRLERKFKTVVIPGRSFQHVLYPGEQRLALACIYSHLVADGTLVMNQYDPNLEYCVPNAEPPTKVNEVTDPGSGKKIRRTFLARTTEPLTQTFTERVLLEVLDETGVMLSREETFWSLRWTYAQEMRYLFELTGFDVVGLHSDYNYGKPAYAKEQIWICRKV